MSETIGGFGDNGNGGGGIPVADDSTRANLAGGGGDATDLWLSNLELGNNIFGAVATLKVGIISYLWFVYYKGGASMTSYYYWTWFSAFLAIYVAWLPVVIAWILTFTGLGFSYSLFYYAALSSILGPLVGYFIPFVLL